jgi:hypothetical protein
MPLELVERYQEKMFGMNAKTIPTPSDDSGLGRKVGYVKAIRCPVCKDRMPSGKK